MRIRPIYSRNLPAAYVETATPDNRRIATARLVYAARGNNRQLFPIVNKIKKEACFPDKQAFGAVYSWLYALYRLDFFLAAAFL